MGVTSVESIKESNFSGGLDFIIICKFSKGEPGGPVFFAVVREGVNILLDFLVGTFSLSIGLEVEGGR